MMISGSTTNLHANDYTSTAAHTSGHDRAAGVSSLECHVDQIRRSSSPLKYQLLPISEALRQARELRFEKTQVETLQSQAQSMRLRANNSRSKGRSADAAHARGHYYKRLADYFALSLQAKQAELYAKAAPDENEFARRVIRTVDPAALSMARINAEHAKVVAEISRELAQVDGRAAELVAAYHASPTVHIKAQMQSAMASYAAVKAQLREATERLNDHEHLASRDA